MTRLILLLGGSPAVSIVVKATVVTALGLIGAWLARGSRAAVRHAALAASFAALLALPAASFLIPPVPIAVAQERLAPSPLPTALDVSQLSTSANANPGVTPSGSRWSVPPPDDLLFAGWIVGAAFLLLRMILGLRQVHVLRRFAFAWRDGQIVVERIALEAGVHRRVDVLLHESLPAPVTYGVFRPAIVLPPDARNLDREDLNRAIVHELEHVRRWDWVSQCFARVVCAAYWFHPLVWFAWRRLSLEAERACDDAVLRRSEATTYADQLVELAQRLSTGRKSPALAMANRSDLAARVRAVLDGRLQRGRAGPFLVMAACVIAAASVLTMSPLRVIAAPQFSPQEPQHVLRFEVASVKPTLDRSDYVSHEIAAGRTSGGGIRVSGRHVDIDSMSMLLLISKAYRFDSRLIGGPDWVNGNEVSFAVHALMPEGTPAEQVPDMIRSLLEERFHLATHRVVADQPAYALLIGKNGPKLKSSGDPDPSICSDWVDGPVGTDNRSCRGSKVVGDHTVKMLLMMKTTWGPMLATWSGNERHEEYFGITMSNLVDILKQGLSPAPGLGPAEVAFVQIVDRTGIDGSWHVVLDTSGGLDERLPSYAASLEKQGLRLERTTAPIEKLIVDSAGQSADGELNTFRERKNQS